MLFKLMVPWFNFQIKVISLLDIFFPQPSISSSSFRIWNPGSGNSQTILSQTSVLTFEHPGIFKRVFVIPKEIFLIFPFLQLLLPFLFPPFPSFLQFLYPLNGFIILLNIILIVCYLCFFISEIDSDS